MAGPQYAFTGMSEAGPLSLGSCPLWLREARHNEGAHEGHGLGDQTEGSAGTREGEQGPWEVTAEDAPVGGGLHAGLRGTGTEGFGQAEKGPEH